MPEPLEPFLVLVHPGSACGSADFNIGKFLARAARDQLAWDLNHWSGHILVIDGALSDELERIPALASAIDGCLTRNEAAGYFSSRVMGDDPDHLLRLQELCDRGLTFAPAFVVTGAWYYPATGDGCVGSAAKLLRERGFEARVDESAVAIEEDEPEDMDAGETIG